MSEKKPRGWGAFDELARKIVAVPKADVDAAKAKKPKKKRKKKS